MDSVIYVLFILVCLGARYLCMSLTQSNPYSIRIPKPLPEARPESPVESRPSKAFLGKDFGMIMKDDNGYMKSAMLIGDPGLGALQESHNINVGILGGDSTYQL